MTLFVARPGQSSAAASLTVTLVAVTLLGAVSRGRRHLAGDAEAAP